MKEKTRVLLIEPDHLAAARLSRALWEADVVVDAAATGEGALFRLRDLEPHAVLCASEVDEALCRKVKQICPHTVLVRVLAPGAEAPEERVERSRADGWVPGPLEPALAVTCCRWAARLGEASRQLERLREELDERAFALPEGLPDSALDDYVFFKRSLQMEVRRSKRYRFPLALLVVGFDRYEESVGKVRVHERTRLTRLLLHHVEATLRDIDLASPGGPDRFLVCLPQTDLEGARHVAERLRHRLAEAAARPDLGGRTLTLSAGVGAYEGTGAEVSFQGLLDEATGRFEHARAQGGDRTESVPLPKSRIPPRSMPAE